MIQMYYLTNFKVVLHFLPEIHLEILPPVGIRIILFFWIKVTETFWTTQTEVLIQIKTRIGCNLISESFFPFWTTHFQDLIQSDQITFEQLAPWVLH